MIGKSAVPIVSPLEEQVISEKIGYNPWAAVRQRKANDADLDALLKAGMIDQGQKAKYAPTPNALDGLADDPRFLDKIFPRK